MLVEEDVDIIGNSFLPWIEMIERTDAHSCAAAYILDRIAASLLIDKLIRRIIDALPHKPASLASRHTRILTRGKSKGKHACFPFPSAFDSG